MSHHGSDRPPDPTVRGVGRVTLILLVVVVIVGGMPLRAGAALVAGGGRLIDDSLVGDRLALFETELTGLRAPCRDLVERHEARTAAPADASIGKLV